MWTFIILAFIVLLVIGTATKRKAASDKGKIRGERLFSYCPRCDAMLSRQATSCTSCGLPLSDDRPALPSADPERTYQEDFPTHEDGRAMTKREAQVWRKMQKVVADDWAKISVLGPGGSNAFTPGKAYYGVIVHVYGSGRLVLTSVGLGDWEARFSPEGTVGVPLRIREHSDRPVRRDETQYSIPEFLAQPAWLRGNGTFSLELVGESRHQNEIAAICGGKTWTGEDRVVWAMIMLGNGASNNTNGIAVQIGGQAVGYISRNDAKEFRARLERESLSGQQFICRANIRGGWNRDYGDEGNYGVRLDMNLYEKGG